VDCDAGRLCAARQDRRLTDRPIGAVWRVAAGSHDMSVAVRIEVAVAIDYPGQHTARTATPNQGARDTDLRVHSGRGIRRTARAIQQLQWRPDHTIPLQQRNAPSGAADIAADVTDPG